MPSREPKNWMHAAGIIWPILADAAKERRKLHYSDLGWRIPTSNISVGRALGPIQDYCLAIRRPPLTAIVISKTTGRPGGGFIAWDVDDLDYAFDEVFRYDWSTLPNPFRNLGVEDNTKSLVRRMIAQPERSEEVYRLVPDRGIAQRIFRKALLEAYDHKCAMCGLSFGEALDGAHLIPWSQASHALRMDVRNGILLCSTHHALFDRRVIKLRLDHTIQYDDVAEEWGPYTDADRQATVALHGRRIRLPEDERLHPDIPLDEL